ncbi:MAG: hypothetical protein JWM71_2491, partial [Solirubrobacteraceae bacterium]|nr:hypothetical protein [Solirubrobacteraceae bacterium]
MPSTSMGDTVQMQMIRRYARVLREQQAQFRGPRIGARELRAARGAGKAARGVAESAARTAIRTGRS